MFCKQCRAKIEEGYFVKIVVALTDPETPK